MAHVAEQLVGRHAELTMVDAALTTLDHGTSAAIELVGEPGIGKTRLLAELAHRADLRGYVVLSGSGSDLESDVPFWVFVDALDDYVRGLDPRQLGLLPETVLAELATVFPSLSAFAAGREVALQHERYRSHRAVRDLLELLANQKPLVLILDDIHWADPASVELLSTLLHRPPAAAVLIAMASRPRQLPERLTITIARAQRAGTLERAELDALSRVEARTFLGDAADGAERSGLYEESGGNPFYLEQLARALERAAPVRSRNADVSLSGIQVPGSVAASLSEELALLSPAARAVLDGAAVAGDPFEPELAAAAAAVSEPSTLEAMNELLRLDLVRQADTPRRFRFRHPLLRRAVYESTPGGWRLAAHGRSAEALAQLGASAASRAHHVEYSARIGDVAAITVLREAGEATADRAPANAARWFTAALRLLGDSGADGQRAQLLTALAGTQAATGKFEDACSALLEAIAQLPDSAMADRVALTAACAGIEQLLGRHEDAHARLIDALEMQPDPASPYAVSLLISLASGAFYRQQTAESRDWGLRALDAAEPLEDVTLIATASAMIALACSFEGETSEGLRYRSRAAQLVDAMPDAQLSLRLDAMAYLTGAEIYLDCFAESIVHGHRALALARATGQGGLLPMLMQSLATGLLIFGRLADAGDVLDGSIEAARLAGHDQTLAWSLLNRAFVSLHEGSVERAAAEAAESVELTRSLEHSLVSTYAGVVMACVHLEAGEPELASELFLGAAGGEGLTLVRGGWRAKYLELLARSRLTSGQHEDAERTAAQAEAVAAFTELRMAQAWSSRARAHLQLDCGDAVGAAASAMASAAACDAEGAVLEAGISRIVAARAFAETGDAPRAAVELDRAVAAFEEWGADRLRVEAERELRKLGRVVSRRSKPGAAAGPGAGITSLTGRELELARLVVDRKTNPEIAATLFLSQKTVEAHLTNIFRKMRVSTRVELARAVEHAERPLTR
jgi:DNA-binding CsgD family transcriptional regulator/tetratricopeptide (TPR) repeat protein